MRESGWKTILEKYWIFLIYAIGIGVQCLLLLSQDQSDSNIVNWLITIAFFLIIFALFVIANRYQQKAIKFKDDLKNASMRIRNLYEEKEENIQDELFKEELFSDINLKNAFTAYKEDSIRMKMISEDADADIENYINQQLLEDSMGMHYLNQISGAMTGLGILGTFIGLSIGLSHFNFTGGDISEEIKPLMDGIKVAFHTSIIGLIYSLCYGFIYNKQLEEQRLVLDEFVADYRKYVVPVTDDGSTETFVKYQQKLVELLDTQILNQKDNSDTLKKMLQEQTRLNSLTETVNKQNVERITSSIEESIVPEIRTMANVLKDFAVETHKDQKEELEKLVNSFITQMNMSLGDSFATLGKVINETTEWQKIMLNELKGVLEHINAMAVDLADINKTIEESVDRVSIYTVQVKDMQDGLNENIRCLGAQNKTNTELCVNANEKLALFREENAAVTAGMENFLEEARNQSTSIHDMNLSLRMKTDEEVERISTLSSETADHIVKTTDDSIQGISTVNTESVNSVREATEKLLAQLEEYRLNMETQSIASIHSIAGLTETAGNAMKEQTENNFAAVKKISDDNRESLTAAYRELESSVKTGTDAMTERLNAGVAAVENQAVQAVQRIGDLSETTSTKLAEQSDRHLAGMEEISRTSTQNLTDTYRELESCMKTGTETMTGRLNAGVAAVENQAVQAVQRIGDLSETTSTKLAEQSDRHLAGMEEISRTSTQNLTDTYRELESSVKTGTETMTGRLSAGVAAVEEQSLQAVQKISSLSEAASSKLADQSEKHLVEVQKISNANMENLETIYHSMEQEITEKLQQLRNLKAIIKDDIENATRALTDAAGGLNEDMIKQINGALESFDVNLAKATSHLSGTIKDMDDTTNKVPMVINQTYMNLEKTFKEMQQMLDQYLEYADKLHRNLEQKWNLLKKEDWK